eukprot:2657110-Pleurochrysis_carterae.AAC.2
MTESSHGRQRLSLVAKTRLPSTALVIGAAISATSNSFSRIARCCAVLLVRMCESDGVRGPARHVKRSSSTISDAAQSTFVEEQKQNCPQ